MHHGTHLHTHVHTRARARARTHTRTHTPSRHTFDCCTAHIRLHHVTIFLGCDVSYFFKCVTWGSDVIFFVGHDA